MTLVSEIMSEYFGKNGRKILKESLPGSLPVKPKKSNWAVTQDKKALLRTFNFKNDNDLRIFVTNLLQLQEEIKHHGQILINYNEVKVKVTTQTLERVTELDLEYASHLDKIYDEIFEVENKLSEDEY